MRLQVASGVAAMLLVGGGLGAGAAYLATPERTGAGLDRPLSSAADGVPAVPRVPTGTPRPYADDIDYPPLTAPSSWTTARIGNDIQTWRYAYPTGWQAYRVQNGAEPTASADELPDLDEVRFRPPDEPTIGGYSLRVKAVDDHVSGEVQVERKITAFDDLDEPEVLGRTDQSVYFTYRTEGDLLRYNFFRWFTAPGSSEATLEMSVSGREADRGGLRALFDEFAGRVEPVGDDAA